MGDVVQAAQRFLQPLDLRQIAFDLFLLVQRREKLGGIAQLLEGDAQAVQVAFLMAAGRAAALFCPCRLARQHPPRQRLQAVVRRQRQARLGQRRHIVNKHREIGAGDTGAGLFPGSVARGFRFGTQKREHFAFILAGKSLGRSR